MFELEGSGAEPLEAGDPQRIGSIPLAGRLGAGGMGRVYLGVHEGRYVAVKQLLSSVVGEDGDFLRRFGHELDNLARLPAEATAPLLASDRTAMPPWFATAYVPGLTLRQAVELHGGPLPARSLWLLLRETASALASVHALDMVHRDIKPSNVMLTLHGLTLIDFGVARATEQSQLTRTGMVVGTPAYMAPEQASGSRGLSGATDVFALASALTYAACGRPPFGEDSGHGVLYRIVHEQPDLGPLRDLDPDLADLVAACLDKDPDGRPTAAEILGQVARKGPFTGPLWPAVVSERLAARAAFAATTQKTDTPTVPLKGKKPDSTPEPGPAPGSAGRPERRRKRAFLAVVPVVVTVGGTTLALQLLPYVSSPGATEKTGPSASASAPAAPGGASGTSGGGPSGPASPGASPSGAGEKGGDKTGDGDEGKAGGKETGGEGGAEGGGGAERVGAGGADGSRTADGGAGTGDDGSGDDGGSGDSGAAASSGGGGPAPSSAAPPPASGTYRYRNGDTDGCVTQTYGGSDLGSCTDSTARWTTRSRSDGSFQLVNQQTGQCLYANMLGQAVFVGDCAQDAGRIWRTSSGGRLLSVFNGGCLDLGTTSFLVTSSCAGEASQRWTRES